MPSVQQVNQQHLSELKGYIDRGDRGGFYMHYHSLTGSEQAVAQAQITTYSGPWGGGALVGNYLAKSANPDIYKLSLDQFSLDIVTATYKAIEASVNRGDTGVFTDDQMQAIDRAVWDDKGLGDYFPGNIQIPEHFISEGTGNSFFPVPAGMGLGNRYEDFIDPEKYSHEGGFDDDSRFVIVRRKSDGSIIYVYDKDTATDALMPDVAKETLIYSSPSTDLGTIS